VSGEDGKKAVDLMERVVKRYTDRYDPKAQHK